MTDFYRELFHPTKEEIIAGYERTIERMEREIQVWKEHVRKLKGQATLNEVEA